MPFEEYAGQPFMLKHEQYKYIVQVCSAKMDNSYTGFSALPTTTTSSGKKKLLVLMQQSPYGSSKKHLMIISIERLYVRTVSRGVVFSAKVRQCTSQHKPCR